MLRNMSSAEKRIRVHVACDHELHRKGLAALLDCHDELQVIRTSPEGIRGVKEVQQTNPDVLVLAVPIREQVKMHADWYRDALPNAGIVGFCSVPQQAGEYLAVGIDVVVHCHSTTSDFLKAIQQVADSYDASG